MVLLSQSIRRAAITGRTDLVDDALLGRQGGRWARQWLGAAFPAQEAATVEDLRRRGAITDAEAERLRARRGGGAPAAGR